MGIVGIHTSIAGEIKNAVLEAEALGCDGFQMFSRNPRGWWASPLRPSDAAAFVAERKRTKLSPVVIHDVYLINLAAEDEALWRKSIQAFRDELSRAMMLDADYLVFHPGNPKGLGKEKGIERTTKGLRAAAKDLDLKNVMILVENTAGMGSALGADFAEVRDILQACEGLPMGCCVDTQHTFAAGYNIADKKQLDETITYIDKTVGLKHVKVVHTNDSKCPLGGRVDRHEHIGQGHIGSEAFRRIFRHPALKHLPFILETPIDREGDDRRNIETVRQLMKN